MMERLTAALADRYRLERELGQGGMATVYLADDLKHDRKVAIKVLRPELAAVIGAERFLSEIRTTAHLQHPHILPLHDSGEAGGFLFYVMPLVEGESLRDRLKREKQLPVADALRIATEIASALDYAHRRNVIHRDIKPENILLHDGRALVADFGIALAASKAGSGARMTETGMSLGTPNYMSPEQAMGERDITARSDVYALGCVTYEMLVGEPPFTGPTAQAIIARVMTEEPRSLTLQRKHVPGQVEAAVRTALEKLPSDRFASTAEFAAALAGPAVAAPAVRREAPRRYASFVAIAVLLAAALAGWLRPAPKAEVSRHRVALWRHAQGEFTSPGIARLSTQAAIAPDGSSIVFSDSVGGVTRLLLKLRGASEPTLLAGTERAVSPFFSPDGAWIGYLTTEGKLKKLPVTGGGSITLSEHAAETFLAAAWLEDGTIVFVDDQQGLRRIPGDGGPGTVVLSDSAGGRRAIGALAPLPGSRGVLFTSCLGNCVTGTVVGVFDLAADSARDLVPNAAGAWYSPTGHLLYTDRGGGLYAAGFDLDRLELTSGAVPVIDDVAPVRFALSASGSAVYSLRGGHGGSSLLTWVSRDGSSEPLDSTWRGEFEYPAISPDGNVVAVSIRDGSTHLWIWRSDGTRQRLTQDGTVNWRASWSADGRSIVYASNTRGGTQDDIDLYRMPVDGSGPAKLLQRHTYGLWEAELSRDGEWLVMRSDEAGGQVNIRARRLRGDTTLLPIVVGKGVSNQVALSPDGRWLAYVSTGTGEREVYVMPFPGGGTSRLVSRDGGSEPRWAHSGRELFYKSGGKLMAVAVAGGPSLTLGAPRALFSVAGYHGARNRQQYDVSPDDRRFLMIRNPGSDEHAQAVYVENWFTELKAKLQAKARP
jgi:eukaryotic-like serine/threonine-protein kinase